MGRVPVLLGRYLLVRRLVCLWSGVGRSIVLANRGGEGVPSPTMQPRCTRMGCRWHPTRELSTSSVSPKPVLCHCRRCEWIGQRRRDRCSTDRLRFLPAFLRCWRRGSGRPTVVGHAGLIGGARSVWGEGHRC